MRKLMAELALVGLVACNDQPTQPADDGATFRAAQGDRSGWTLIALLDPIPIEQAYPWGASVPCINGGQGEYVDTWGGPYGYYMKVVNNPNGTVMHQGWVTVEPGGFDYLRGLTTGDVWVATADEFRSWHFHWKYLPDGSWEAWGTGEETLTKVGTTERITLRVVQHYVVDAAGNASRATNHITACRVLK